MRWAEYFNIPISSTAPPGFPINTLPLQRTLAALSLSHPATLEDAMTLFYEHTWVQWAEPLKAANLLALVARVVGTEEAAARVLEATKSDEVKKVLAANTDAAFKDGAFGLPYFVGELTCLPGGDGRGGYNRWLGLMCVRSNELKGRDGGVLGRRSYGPVDGFPGAGEACWEGMEGAALVGSEWWSCISRYYDGFFNFESLTQINGFDPTTYLPTYPPVQSTHSHPSQLVT